MTITHFENGAHIFRQGDLSGSVYLVKTGSVRISKTTRDGQVIELGTVGPNGMFGEMALIDSTLRMATATAVGPTSCLVAEAAQLLKRIQQMRGDALIVYNDMASYIRGNLPFEARSAAQQARGDTDEDARARQLLRTLPAFLESLKDASPSVLAVFHAFADYIQRRLPPPL